MEIKGNVPEQVKQVDKLFGSQVRQFEDYVQAVHYDGFSISAVKPTAHWQVFVVPLRVIELSHVKHY